MTTCTIKFEKDSAGRKNFYWFMGPRGRYCCVFLSGKQWVAKGENWWGWLVMDDKTRGRAAARLVSELEP